jgi:hypothetical protein
MEGLIIITIVMFIFTIGAFITDHTGWFTK